MISQIMEFALFLAVLFLIVPGLMIFLMVGRGLIHHHKPAGWHKDLASK